MIPEEGNVTLSIDLEVVFGQYDTTTRIHFCLEYLDTGCPKKELTLARVGGFFNV